MKKIYSIITLFFLPACLLQAGEFVLVKTYSEIHLFEEADKLGNLYYIKEGVLYRTDPDGRLLSYSNPSWGAVSSLDAGDPLNLLVFFKDFGRIVMLDKNLSPKKHFNGEDLHDFDVPSRICHSGQGGFWGYFASDFTLARFNDMGVRQLVSADLSLLSNDLSEITGMVEKDGRLFVAANGIWVFDLFANLLFRIPEIVSKDFQVADRKIFYLNQDHLHVYDFFLRRENVILLPEKGVRSFFVLDKDLILLQTDVSLKKFRYKANFY